MRTTQVSRRAALLSGAVAASGVMAACGQANGGQDGGGTAAKRPATVQYWARYAGAIGEVEEKSIPVFKNTFPHLTVERIFVTGSYDNLLEKVTTSFASGTPPAVFNIGSSGIATYAHPGSVLQLDTIPRLKKESADFFVPANTIGTYKGKLYGMTWYIDSRMPLYRKDLLAEVGAATDRKGLPKTWNQFREVTKKLAKWDGAQISRVGFDVPVVDLPGHGRVGCPPEHLRVHCGYAFLERARPGGVHSVPTGRTANGLGRPGWTAIAW